MTQDAAKARGLLERPNDTRIYIVGVGLSTRRMTWRQMTDPQRLGQLEAENRAYYEDLFDPCGLA